MPARSPLKTSVSAVFSVLPPCHLRGPGSVVILRAMNPLESTLESNAETTPNAPACDRLISAAWVLPIAPENVALADHAVAFADQEIVAVGPTAELTARYPEAEHEALGEQILSPGLVNAHGHTAMTLLRGAGEDQALQDWLADTIWPLEGRLMSSEFVALGSELAIAEMLQTGTTTFADMYFFPDVVAANATAAGMRAQVAFPVIDFPNAWSDSVADGLHKGLALCDAYKHDGLVQVAFGPHSAYTVSEENLGKVAMYANELENPVHIHLHENPIEVAEARAKIGRSWLHLLNDIGLLGPSLQAVHMTQLTPEEIALVAETRTRVVHCPASNLKLASGYSPVADLIAAGVTVGLGTDGAASNNQLDMFDEMRLAALMAKHEAADPTHGAAADMLRLATLGGATALGLEHLTGSLEPGKRADMISVNLDDFSLQPLYDPFAAMVHGGAGRAVSNAWINGRQVLRDGVHTTIDREALLGHVREWRIASA